MRLAADLRGVGLPEAESISQFSSAFDTHARLIEVYLSLHNHKSKLERESTYLQDSKQGVMN